MLIKSKKYQCNPSTFLFSFIVSHKDLKSSKRYAATLIFRRPLATQKTKLKETPKNIANVLQKKNRQEKKPFLAKKLFDNFVFVMLR